MPHLNNKQNKNINAISPSKIFFISATSIFIFFTTKTIFIALNNYIAVLIKHFLIKGQFFYPKTLYKYIQVWGKYEINQFEYGSKSVAKNNKGF